MIKKSYKLKSHLISIKNKRYINIYIYIYHFKLNYMPCKKYINILVLKFMLINIFDKKIENILKT